MGSITEQRLCIRERSDSVTQTKQCGPEKCVHSCERSSEEQEEKPSINSLSAGIWLQWLCSFFVVKNGLKAGFCTCKNLHCILLCILFQLYYRILSFEALYFITVLNCYKNKLTPLI